MFKLVDLNQLTFIKPSDHAQVRADVNGFLDRLGKNVLFDSFINEIVLSLSRISTALYKDVDNISYSQVIFSAMSNMVSESTAFGSRGLSVFEIIDNVVYFIIRKGLEPTLASLHIHALCVSDIMVSVNDRGYKSILGVVNQSDRVIAVDILGSINNVRSGTILVVENLTRRKQNNNNQNGNNQKKKENTGADAKREFSTSLNRDCFISSIILSNGVTISASSIEGKRLISKFVSVFLKL